MVLGTALEKSNSSPATNPQFAAPPGRNRLANLPKSVTRISPRLAPSIRNAAEGSDDLLLANLIGIIRPSVPIERGFAFLAQFAADIVQEFVIAGKTAAILRRASPLPAEELWTEFRRAHSDPPPDQRLDILKLNAKDRNIVNGGGHTVSLAHSRRRFQGTRSSPQSSPCRLGRRRDKSRVGCLRMPEHSGAATNQLARKVQFPCK
jgi:hypothetical protein